MKLKNTHYLENTSKLGKISSKHLDKNYIPNKKLLKQGIKTI
jgi:hypothetical protein